MKTIFNSFLFLFITNLAVAQISKYDKVIYLDSTHFETNSKEYVYTRVIKDYKKKNENYTILEYYKSGKLRMEGTSKTNIGFTNKEGKYTYYYENGNKKLEEEFVENKEKRSKQYKINQFWDVNGIQKVVNGNGFFEDQGENESAKGELKNGLKEGVWEGVSIKPYIIYQETYTNGVLTSGTSSDKYGNTYTYTEVEVLPKPKNGMIDFYKFVGTNYQMTNPLRGVNGKIYVSFVVDKDGKIVEPKIVSDLGNGTGKEAIRVVSKYNGFVAGEQRGQKVKFPFTVPISIQSTN